MAGGVDFHFDFDPNTMDFDVDGVPDTMLDMSALPDLSPELPKADYGDLAASAPVREKSQVEVATEVEEDLIALLEQERRKDILVLTGETPDALSAVDPDVQEEFGTSYTRALLHNPGLKWYGKFTRVLPKDAFYAKGGEVHLTIGRDVFRKLVWPCINDFRWDCEDHSPIVSIVRQLAATFDARFKEKIEAERAKEVQASTVDEPNQLRPDHVEFDASLPDDGMGGMGGGDPATADLKLFDDLMGNPSVENDDHGTTPKLDISLYDLSNKAVAEYLADSDMDLASIESRLDNDGFETARRNEVSSIVRYMRLDRSLKSKPTGNFGGDTGFPFKL